MGRNIKELIATVLILIFIGVVIWNTEQRNRAKKIEEPVVDRTDSILMLTDKKIDEVISYKQQADFVVDSLTQTIKAGKKKSKMELDDLKNKVESLANEANTLKSIPAEKKIIYEKKQVFDTVKVEVKVLSEHHVQVIDTVHVNDTITWKKSLNRYKQMKK